MKYFCGVCLHTILCAYVIVVLDVDTVWQLFVASFVSICYTFWLNILIDCLGSFFTYLVQVPEEKSFGEALQIRSSIYK